MAKLQITQAVYERALERVDLDREQWKRLDDLRRPDVEDPEEVTLALEIRQLPREVLLALLDEAELTVSQRTQIAMHAYGMSDVSAIDRESIYDRSVSSPVEFGSTLLLLGNKTPTAELFLNGRWYPVILNVNFYRNYLLDGSCWVLLTINLSICDESLALRYDVASDYFFDESGQPCQRTVEEILKEHHLRRLRCLPLDFNLRLIRAERTGRESGRQIMVTGSVLTLSQSGYRLIKLALGTPKLPRRGIIEPELETDQYNHGRPGCEGVTRLPLIRVFSLETKRYVYPDVDDIIDYEYDESALDRLHLPDRIRTILGQVFATQPDQLFGDLIQTKHGGAVILASGKPGVGKTLTAEVYAEQTQRPLYVLELGELGTNPDQVEDNLQRIFARVDAWNAVLQFDECEIFLARRDADLQRSAIVGIFLRLLDSYRGILFLTTNRPEVLDPAILSRVMLKLDYPDLDAEARNTIWRTMFQHAGLTLVDDAFDELAAIELNGRQIRNLTRLARITAPERTITANQVRDLLIYGTA